MTRLTYTGYQRPACGHRWCEKETVRDGRDVAFLLQCMMDRGVLSRGDDGRYHLQAGQRR